MIIQLLTHYTKSILNHLFVRLVRRIFNYLIFPWRDKSGEKKSKYSQISSIDFDFEVENEDEAEIQVIGQFDHIIFITFYSEMLVCAHLFIYNGLIR